LFLWFHEVFQYNIFEIHLKFLNYAAKNLFIFLCFGILYGCVSAEEVKDIRSDELPGYKIEYRILSVQFKDGHSIDVSTMEVEFKKKYKDRIYVLLIRDKDNNYKILELSDINSVKISVDKFGTGDIVPILLITSGLLIILGLIAFLSASKH